MKYTYLFLVLLDSPDHMAQANHTRDMAQCQYVAENLREDIRIAGKNAEVYCIESNDYYRTGQEIPFKEIIVNPIPKQE